MKKRKKNVIYCIAYMVLWVVFRIVMPTRCINKQNRPEGGALLCANHTHTNDPLFIAYALGGITRSTSWPRRRLCTGPSSAGC